MNWADFSIIFLILLSGVLSFFNGFVRELFSFLGWLFSGIIAFIFLEELAELLMTRISFPDLRLAVALITLFLASFILLEWTNYLILNSIGRTDLSVPDRLLGVLFGISRGGVIVIFLMILAGLTQFPSTSWWQQSFLIQNFKPIVVELRSHWPLEIAIKFNFDPEPEQRLPSF
ncbi:MAG TPA: CvpA family protein [Thiotrichaceae bacterium]|nr:CvpA family protein [Thiotrichaceae bacterium]